jgi:photosystem II stability/assembly factor-like uncharacterized protein
MTRLPNRSRSAVVRRLMPLAVAALAASLHVGSLHARETVPASSLSAHTHVHGLAVDGSDPAYLLVATHHGLYRVGPDGNAQRISATRDDFMGFTAHPTQPKVLYASGHPVRGGNLGFVASTDGGVTWRRLSAGVNGPVDFHQMAVSAADPKRIYGVHAGLQVSDDGGRTWRMVGPAPAGILALAASARDVDTLYAATREGLQMSRNAGRSWTALPPREPVSLVEVGPDGYLYKFVVGRGLIRAADPPMKTEVLGRPPGQAILLHLAIDPTNRQRLFAATTDSVLLTSSDGGRSWALLGPDK